MVEGVVTKVGKLVGSSYHKLYGVGSSHHGQGDRNLNIKTVFIVGNNTFNGVGLSCHIIAIQYACGAADGIGVAKETVLNSGRSPGNINKVGVCGKGCAVFFGKGDKIPHSYVGAVAVAHGCVGAGEGAFKQHFGYHFTVFKVSIVVEIFGSVLTNRLPDAGVYTVNQGPAGGIDIVKGGVEFLLFLAGKGFTYGNNIIIDV